MLKNVSSGTGENADPRGAAVEFFCNMLAEMRSKGQGFMIADQIPSKLAPDLIKNTNMKILHRTVAEEDRSLMGGAMHMTEAQVDYVSSLPQGHAAVYSEGDNRPKIVNPPYAGSFTIQELNIIENTDNLSFSDYLLLWLLTREENSSDKDDERQASDDDYIEVDETITDKEYWLIKERLEDNGFIVTSALFDDEVLLLTIRSKCGKSYKFKVFSKGGVIMDDYEGNDYSESESDNEDSVEATADNNDANAELIRLMIQMKQTSLMTKLLN